MRADRAVHDSYLSKSSTQLDPGSVHELLQRPMHHTLEAIVDETGRVTLAEPVPPLTGSRRALLIILDNEPATLSTVASGGRGAESQYRIDRALGSGGMGEAFVGTNLATGGAVCIKRLRPGVRDEVLTQEWRSLSRVDSRYVVRYLDRYVSGDLLHLVMEFVAGPTLADLLKAGLHSGEIGWLGLSLMRGVLALHQADVIHCDLKPQNVLIDQKGPAQPGEPGWVPKIIDFGLAILDRHDAEGVQTRQGGVAGTPAYMAPEQVTARMLSPACDVYAVGVILYEALTGSRAFTGEPLSIMFDKARQTDGLRVESLPPGVPAAVAGLVLRCTRPDPEVRPTADEAVEFLEQCLGVAPNPALPRTELTPTSFRPSSAGRGE